MPGARRGAHDLLVMEGALADTFLSFDPADRLAASAIRKLLASKGYSAVTESDVPLGAWRDNALERELRKARCVIVLWSARSRLNVRICNQAAFAERHSRYLPVLIAPCEPPVALMHINAADLSGRRQPDVAANAALLLQRVAALVGGKSEANSNPRRTAPPSPPNIVRKVAHRFALAISALLAFAVIGASGVPRNVARYPDAVRTIWTASSADALCKAPAADRLNLQDCAATGQRVRVAWSRLRHFGETGAAVVILQALLWTSLAMVDALVVLCGAAARGIIKLLARRDRRLARTITALN